MVSAKREAAVAHRALTAGVALTVVAMTTFLVLPQFVASLIADRGFAEADAGILASVLMAGAALASAVAGSWVQRWPWRRTATLSLLALIAGNGALMSVRDFGLLLSLEFVIGFAGGSLYSLALTALSQGPRPGRSFGLSLASQVAFQVGGLAAGPWFDQHGGLAAILTLFAAAGVLGLCLVSFLPPANTQTTPTSPSDHRRLGVAVWFAFAGCFLFFFNVGVYWTYIGVIGMAAGLSSSAVDGALAVGVSAGIAGGLLASWWSDRRGWLMPILSCAVLTVFAAWLMAGTLRLGAFAASALIYNFVWNLSLAVQYSAVHAVDRSGKGVAMAPAFHGAGGAAGPAVAALCVTLFSHTAVVWLVTVSVILSAMAFFMAWRLSAVPRSMGDAPNSGLRAEETQ